MLIKEVFDKAENGTLTFEQFESIVKDAKAKFMDVGTGDYVSRQKYEDEVSTLNNQIETLNGTITQRDTDLASLQTQLEAAGTDAEKLANLSSDLSALQGRYDNDVKTYKEQLKKQAYEFAVKEFASTKKFTSQAAKRDFINSMLAKDLKMDNGKILGAEDFSVSYSAENADAFITEQQTPTPAPVPDQKPAFVAPTQGGNTPPAESNAFLNAFHFTGVRPVESN